MVKGVDAKFCTDGCGTSITCCRVVTESIKGKSVIEALRIDSEYNLKDFGELPKSHIHCAVLASDTLRASALMILV